MANTGQFINLIAKKYKPKTASITLGVGMLDNKVIAGTDIKIPIKTLNRHGLIAGATGTGKTKTLQLLSELLSDQGVNVLLMDLKGDLSGLSQPGISNEKITERQKYLGLDPEFKKFPVEILTLSNNPGVKLRATVSEFGPILFAKMLNLNNTQTELLAILFEYSKNNNLALLDLKDIKQLITYAQNEGQEELTKQYGNIPSASLTTIMRKIIALESQGGAEFFNEPSFDVNDLLLKNNNNGIISILKLTDLQDKPNLFSTFMLALLTEVYGNFPEAGDLEKPKLIIIIDEAHLVFEEATKALQQRLETIIKLIRSKGVGIFFCTQNPADIPEDILGQLGLKIQHALRAFTAKDRKNIKLAAENYPDTKFYNTKKLITQLGIGEALVTALNTKGIPTPLVQTMLQAPKSRMGVITDLESAELINNSNLVKKYAKTTEKNSAHEILQKKIADNKLAEQKVSKAEQEITLEKKTKKSKSLFGTTTIRQIIRTVIREVIRIFFRSK